MGWWKVQNTEDLVGDEPFDMMRDATIAIARLYQREFDRLPTRTEWQLLIHDALELEAQLDSSGSASLFQEGGRPQAVEIVLAR
jgi:hypothetical protein